jgi:hypothetical protein
VSAVLVTLFEGYPGAPADEQKRVPGYVEVLLAHLGADNESGSEQGEDAFAPVLGALTSALGPAWWSNVADREGRQTLFEAARVFASRQSATAPQIDELLAGDLERALEQGGAALDQVLGDLRELARGLSPELLERLSGLGH